MYSKILDQKTYLAVVQAAPFVPGEYDRIAFEIVSILGSSLKEEEREPFSRSISELSEKLAAFEVSPAQVGRIVGELGLVKVRRRDGYHVYFTAKQLTILGFALREQVK